MFSILNADLTKNDTPNILINILTNISNQHLNQCWTSGAGGPGVPARQVRADHDQLQAQREEQEGKMVGPWSNNFVIIKKDV